MRRSQGAGGAAQAKLPTHALAASQAAATGISRPSQAEARNRLDKVFASGRSFKSVQEILVEIYNQGA